MTPTPTPSPPTLAQRVPPGGVEPSTVTLGLSPNTDPTRGPTRLGVEATEWAWVGSITLLIMLVTQVPPTLERLAGPADRVHLGNYYYASDFGHYHATMLEAATTDSWLTHTHFSSEMHEPIIMYSLYVLIGKLSAWTGASILQGFAVWELLMRLFLPAALYIFLASVIPPNGRRRLAFVLAAFSGGLGVWLGLAAELLTKHPAPTSGQTVNTFVETVTLGTFLAAPHIGIGLGLTLLGITLFAAACRGVPWTRLLLTVDVLLLALVHPFNLPVLLATFGVFAVVQSLRQRRADWAAWGATAAAMGVGSPLALYNFLTFNLSPFWSATFGAQNVMPSPRPWELPLDYGVVFFLAPLGLLAIRRGATLEQRLLVTWLLVGLVCMYAPVPYQRRFGFGLQPALAALAALGWPLLRPAAFRVVTHLGVPAARRPAVARRLVQYPFLVFAFATSLTALLTVGLSTLTNRPVPMYQIDRDMYQVGEWLGDHTNTTDVTAGAYTTGNVLAGLLPGRVVLGYGAATLNVDYKLDMTRRLYRGELTPDETRGFLQENRVTYLVVGAEERAIGPHDPGSTLGLSVAVRFGNAVAYRVALPLE